MPTITGQRIISTKTIAIQKKISNLALVWQISRLFQGMVNLQLNFVQ